MHGRPARAVAERRSPAIISDDESLSDSDSDTSSENNVYCSEDKQGSAGPRKNIPQSEIVRGELNWQSACAGP